MSNTTSKPEANDPLLTALRELPPCAVPASHHARVQRAARAAYLRSFEPSRWHGSVLGDVGRAAMPVFLAGIVGVYMSWAIAAATALVD